MTASTIRPGTGDRGRCSRNIYVASLWRNQLQQHVVRNRVGDISNRTYQLAGLACRFITDRRRRRQPSLPPTAVQIGEHRTEGL